MIQIRQSGGNRKNNNIVIPYVVGISEKLGNILTKYHIPAQTYQHAEVGTRPS